MSSAYAVGWTENAGSDNSNYAVKSTALGSPINLNINGRDMQLHNGFELAPMRGVALSTSIPYAFQLSDPLQSGGLMASASEDPLSGRIAVLSGGDMAHFYFGVTGISVDDQHVGFPETPETEKAVLTGLVSDPFMLTASSSLKFDIQYGVRDSLAALAIFGKKDYVAFRLQLIDADTKEVIETLDNVNFDRSNVVRRNEVQRAVKSGIALTRNVQLRFIAETSLDVTYSVGNVMIPQTTSLAVKSASGPMPELIEPSVPTEFSLSNYPNPFNPVTNIQYAIPETHFVTLKVYDMLGREIAVLVNEQKQAGVHTVPFDASRLPSGVYFYHLTAGSFTNIKKMSVTK